MIQTSIYSKIKKQVGCRDAAIFYGHIVDQNGMMKCPFHPDRNPSMKVDQNFICFGCGERGDVIRFASLLFGLSVYEAAVKLATDMSLNISDGIQSGVKPSTAQRTKRKQTEVQQFEQAVSRIYQVYCDYLHLLNEWTEVHAPRFQDEEFHPLFIEAIEKKDYVEYLLDLLFCGSEEDKVLVVIDKAKEVKDLERRIKEYQS